LTLPPIFLLADRPNDQNMLAEALALPQIAGVVIRPGAADLFSENFAAFDAVLPFVRPDQAIHLGVSALPCIPGVSTIALDGGEYVLAFDPANPPFWLQALQNGINELGRRGVLAQFDGARLCDTVAATGDAEWAYKVFAASDFSVRYDAQWLANGFTRDKLLANITTIGAGMAAMMPGKRITFCILDPLAGVVRIDADGNLMDHRDLGAFAAEITAAANAAAVGCTLQVLDTNVGGADMPQRELPWCTVQGRLAGGFVGQISVSPAGSGAAVVAAKVANAAQNGAACVEIHQKDAGAALFAALASL
jgi:hypothetical protein